MVIVKLSKVLEEKNLTHREFSRLTNIRHPTISAMCNNTVKHIPLDNLDVICKFLECDISDILEFKKEQSE